MQTVCSKGSVIMGCDVSHWQPNIDWQKVKAYNVDFVFIKASEGTIEDPSFKSHWQGAKDAGIIRGAYHFFHPGIDPEAQIQYFMSLIHESGYESEDLPPTIDWETTDSIPSYRESGLAGMFSGLIFSQIGRMPIIYGSPYFLETLNLASPISTCPLWVAHYGPKCPLVPQPWTDWTFWQKTDSGSIDGIGPCDIDVFNGSLDDLKAICI